MGKKKEVKKTAKKLAKKLQPEVLVFAEWLQKACDGRGITISKSYSPDWDETIDEIFDRVRNADKINAGQDDEETMQKALDLVLSVITLSQCVEVA